MYSHSLSLSGIKHCGCFFSMNTFNDSGLNFLRRCVALIASRFCLLEVSGMSSGSRLAA